MDIITLFTTGLPTLTILLVGAKLWGGQIAQRKDISFVMKRGHEHDKKFIAIQIDQDKKFTAMQNDIKTITKAQTDHQLSCSTTYVTKSEYYDKN